MTRTWLSGLVMSTLVAAVLIPTTANAAPTAHYTVRRGDTLWSIAARYRTTVEAITQANGISDDAVLPVGNVIAVPIQQTATEPSRSGDVSLESRSQVHTGVENVCLRTGPSTGHRKIAVLDKGTTGKVLAEKGKWTKIALGDGTCGYVYGPLLASGPGTIHYSRENPLVKQAAGSESGDDNSSLVETALSCRGVRYRHGGTSRRGFDCSGFTRYVFAKYGVSLPHSSAAQASLGTHVSRSELQPGDLVFFQTNGRGISHVGIYIGDNKFVHAPRYGRSVSTDSLSSSYYGPRYRGARRVR